ncbi:MAG TPA: phosphatase domain-containing protein [Candidatus Lustribacter sp.]|nr:phosphatase domain-containing protein [Candidatus Lustribacter sp.]
MARPHASSIVEDAWHRQLDRALRRRGWKNRIIPFTGYGSLDFVRVFGRVLLRRPDDPDGPDDFEDITYGGLRSPYVTRRGWRSFLTAPAMGVPITVTVGHHVAHGRSDRSGHIDTTFRGHGLAPGWGTVTIAAQHAEPVEAPIFVVGPDVRFGIVSDIDDTVISTSLPRPMIAAWNTFVKHESARRVVPGMAPLYRELLTEHPGAPIAFVSTGAWNTAPTLARFLKTGGFPLGPLLLTDWGPTNTGWFRSGQDHKRACLDRLARDFPAIQWLLIGDDGQHDPKIYQDFAEARPDRVDAIAIRQLTPTEMVLSHGLPVSNEELVARQRPPREMPVVYAPDGYGLARLLRASGRLSGPDHADGHA